MRNARTKLVWLADAVCVAYFHAQTGTAMPRVSVSVCVCGGCVAVSGRVRCQRKCFEIVSRRFAWFLHFFCLLVILFTFLKIFNFRINDATEYSIYIHNKNANAKY